MNFKYGHRAKYPPHRLSFGKKDGNGPGIPVLPSSRRSRAAGSVQSIGESYTRYRQNNGEARFRVLQPRSLSNKYTQYIRRKEQRIKDSSKTDTQNPSITRYSPACDSTIAVRTNAFRTVPSSLRSRTVADNRPESSCPRRPAVSLSGRYCPLHATSNRNRPRKDDRKAQPQERPDTEES